MEINPCVHGQFIYNKGGKDIQRENTTSSINVMGKLDNHMQKNHPGLPGSPEGNTEGPGTASSEPLLPS